MYLGLICRLGVSARSLVMPWDLPRLLWACSLQNGGLVSCWGPREQLPMALRLAVETPMGLCL